jgi:chromosome segregation ATPase
VQGWYKMDQYEKRLTRVEDKIDNVKAEVVELRSHFKNHMTIVQEHIIGDNKIIDNLNPLLDNLKELVDDYKYKKTKKTRHKEALILWTKRLGLVSAIISVIYGIRGLL